MKSSGFTLIELLVVIAIIGVIGSVALSSLDTARSSARDAVRIQDMRALRFAFEQFYNDNNRYPGALDGVPSSGQMLGVGNEIDVALQPYIDPVPRDPRHDAGTGVAPTAGALYFYSYDPWHWRSMTDCGGTSKPADTVNVQGLFGFNKAENSGNYTKDTCWGTHMNLDDADYNFFLSDR
jgi:prepilin-type N-terminal cleavage/methylation domain-containing protein